MSRSTASTQRHLQTLPMMAAIATLSSIALVACGGGSDSGSTLPVTAASTGTAGVLCDYRSSVFNSNFI